MLNRHLLGYLRKPFTQSNKYLNSLKEILGEKMMEEPIKKLDPTPIYQPFLDLKRPSDYQKIHSEIVNAIDLKTKSYFDYVPKRLINPLPILVSESQLKEFKDIQEALFYSIQAIVSNFFNDQRISDVFNFPEKVMKVLELYRDKTYDRVGSFR